MLKFRNEIIVILLLALTQLKVNSQEEFPHKVWVYWSDSEQNMPMIYKLCYRKMKQIISNSSWELILLTDANIFQYIDQKELTEIKRQSKVMFIQQLVDMIKLMIMIQHGGVYIDLSSILIQDFSWLQLKNLISNQHVINKYGNFPDVLFFYNSMFLNNNIQITKSGLKTLTFPNFQTWFMAAKPNTLLMKQWKKSYQNLFFNDFSYFQRFRKQQNLYLRNLDRQNLLMTERTLTYLSINVAMQYVLQKKQQEFDKELTIFSSLQDRKLAVNYYKVWTISCFTGPLTLLPKTGSSNHYNFIINLISQTPKYLDEEQQQFIQKPNYFLKLTGQQATKLQYFFLKENEIHNFQYEISLISYVFNIVNMTCQNHLFIQKDSYLEKYLLRNNTFALQNLNVKILTQRQKSQLCKNSGIKAVLNYFFVGLIASTFIFFAFKISLNFQKAKASNKILRFRL